MISKAGHDKGRVYVILGILEDRILVADGTAHRVDAPKKKNPVHLQPVNTGIGEELKDKLEKMTLKDEEISKAIRIWMKQDR